MKWSTLYNPIMAAILRSPLHGMISGGVMLLTFTGRKSGRTYTIPVEYFYDGETVMVVTLASRTWWRNLRGGAPVTVSIKRQKRQGHAEAYNGDPQVFEAAMRAYLERYPNRASLFDIRQDADGAYNAADLARAAGEKVFVRITLD